MRLAVGIPSFGPLLPRDRLDRVVEVARLAETAGAGAVSVPDHVLMSEGTDRYVWGRFPLPIDTPFLEPMTVLAAVAGATERVRLATAVLIAPLRPAPLLAKTAATLDVLSRGRLDLGVGTGWQKEEFDAVGADYGSRGRALDDTVAACRALWAESPASFESPTVRFERVWCEPKPVQPGGVPIFFSGSLTHRNLRRITRLGDGWIPIMGTTPDGLADGVARLREAWADAGRDPAGLRVRGTLPIVRDDARRPLLGPTLESAPDLARRGATEIDLPLQAFVRRPEEIPSFFAELGERWREARRLDPGGRA